MERVHKEMWAVDLPNRVVNIACSLYVYVVIVDVTGLDAYFSSTRINQRLQFNIKQENQFLSGMLLYFQNDASILRAYCTFTFRLYTNN